MCRVYLMLLGVFSLGVIQAQTLEKTEPLYIKSIQFQGGSQQAQLPVVKLGESIRLSFDDLRGTEEDFYYKILVKTCLVDLQGNAHLRIF